MREVQNLKQKLFCSTYLSLELLLAYFLLKLMEFNFLGQYIYKNPTISYLLTGTFADSEAITSFVLFSIFEWRVPVNQDRRDSLVSE